MSWPLCDVIVVCDSTLCACFVVTGCFNVSLSLCLTPRCAMCVDYFLINVACRIVSYMSWSVSQQAIEPNCVSAVWIKTHAQNKTHIDTLNLKLTANPHCFMLFLRITECVSLRSHSCHLLGYTVLLTMCRRWCWNCGGRVQRPVVHKLLLHLTLHSFLPL